MKSATHYLAPALMALVFASGAALAQTATTRMQDLQAPPQRATAQAQEAVHHPMSKSTAMHEHNAVQDQKAWADQEKKAQVTRHQAAVSAPESTRSN